MPEIVTQTNTFEQPIEISTKVGIEVDSKGQRKPNVEIKISRKVGKEDATKFYGFILDDLQIALSECKKTLTKAMEENK